MKVNRWFEDTDRHEFDFGGCRGWQQWDNEQDAWYYGNWLNIDELKSMSYVEGDVTEIKFNDIKEFSKHVKDGFAKDIGFKHIDVGIGKNREGLLNKYREAGLGEYVV